MRLSVVALSLALSACTAQATLDREIGLAKFGDEAFSTFDDLILAERALPARLERLEALVRAAPDVVDVRTMLVISWTREGLLFAEDDSEDAFEHHDAPSVRFHAMRAENAYERAIHHGSAWLSLAGPSFDAAVAEGHVDAFLATRKGDDARALAWLGAAFVGHARLGERDAPKAALANRAGRALLERSIALDEAAEGGFALAIRGDDLGHGGDVEGARRDLERALTVSKRHLLLAQVFLARRVICAAHDRTAWDAAYREVLEARDPSPEVRLENAEAKRLAERDVQGTRRAQCVP